MAQRRQGGPVVVVRKDGLCSYDFRPFTLKHTALVRDDGVFRVQFQNLNILGPVVVVLGFVVFVPPISLSPVHPLSLVQKLGVDFGLVIIGLRLRKRLIIIIVVALDLEATRGLGEVLVQPVFVVSASAVVDNSGLAVLEFGVG